MYRNWLRNENEARDFPAVFREKFLAYQRKMRKQQAEFVSYQVGFIEYNTAEPSYRVHLVGEEPYKVRWADFVEDKWEAYGKSLARFCKTNSVELVPSKTRNVLIIKTVFSP